jgi:hypothetical protein
LASSPSVFTRQSTQLSLQAKTKSARFINGVHFSSLALEFGGPVQKRFFSKALWRLGITSPLLQHHGVKFLVHINPKLDDGFAAIKLTAGFLV